MHNAQSIVTWRHLTWKQWQEREQYLRKPAIRHKRFNSLENLTPTDPFIRCRLRENLISVKCTDIYILLLKLTLSYYVNKSNPVFSAFLDESKAMVFNGGEIALQPGVAILEWKKWGVTAGPRKK